ncbi:MAG: polysulfide reductase NrfD [Alphaproteobacteria bacterium]|nr:polysulfide reductase NrfD [Alphaproteobacteria bacterium]MBF0128883.1 polysulfide reductase NrfD [Alphaproteobacteria bacterium]
MSATTKIVYRELDGHSPHFWRVLGGVALFVLAGLMSAFYMEHHGHHVTGMTNQVVWGMPHVFAVFLIVAASGALNIASIGSVFERGLYKPLARLSGLLALCLLAGGLTVLLLDLGRADRLIVAMTHYNFRSIFAWNVLLYSGFFGIVAAYLWTMMSRHGAPFYKPAAFAAFLWRLTLTTGTGSIFGFLVARDAYNAAIMAPMFIAMSFAYGKAIFMLIMVGVYTATGRPLGDVVVTRLQRLMGIVLAATLYFVLVQHLTNLYMEERRAVEAFILTGDTIHTFLFWVVQIGIGGIIPLVLLLHPRLGGSRSASVLASVLIIMGGLAQVYVIIIGGQTYPLTLFPGMEASSQFFDGVVNTYTPTLAEIVLGIGGMGIALALVLVACALLRFLPESLADEVIDPDHVAKIVDMADEAGNAEAAKA